MDIQAESNFKVDNDEFFYHDDISYSNKLTGTCYDRLENVFYFEEYKTPMKVPVNMWIPSRLEKHEYRYIVFNDKYLGLSRREQMKFYIEDYLHLLEYGHSWVYVVVSAKCTINGVMLGENTLYGVEYSYTGDNEYLEEVRKECEEEAKSIALQNLKRLSIG